ncbi:hypothetical protein MON38_00520 [Hymenobacter sp. DH14]|uniref:Tetratricopeptide repeat protein n=1 Tax=Hymenobacter cyanobacteriorum TaxID=2926463 RepID=A0A9X1VB75_9BACT|nr:hypothetical protein [Hymenobacter cyanobacteriorum]MCI1185884.1 hypothetical protein [Hymenobacter cyanobacteriorum]
MKTGALLLLLVLGVPGLRLLTMVRDRNVAVADATAAYRQGEALLAAHQFENALATASPRTTPDPRLVLNLGHAQTRAGLFGAAQATYGRLLTGSPARLSSVARQQLAVLAAGRGELAQAASLLRQAIILDPTNAGARYDFEVVSDYLARRPNRPQLPPPLPPGASKDAAPKAAPEKNGAQPNNPAEKEGTDRKGEVNDTKPAPDANTPPAPRPDAAGQPDNRQPSALPGAAAGNRTPGDGTPQPTASGDTPGTQRGLDRSAATGGTTPNNRSNRPGSEAATGADLSLQTQRERLQAMSLSPAQARQLLETLRAQEQQYLQQRPRPAAQKADPNRPTW